MTTRTLSTGIQIRPLPLPAKSQCMLAAIVIILLALLGGCAKSSVTGVTNLKANSFSELERYLLSKPADLETFKVRGPFSVDTRENRELKLPSGDTVIGDLYLAEHGNRAPLVILLHGYDNSKADHGYQAMHLASWGLHALSLQLPTHGPWSENGHTLARIANLVQKNPELLDQKIDGRRIVLAGHSFGGSSVAIAMGDGAPVLGGILLDPAIADGDMRGALGRINKPVMLIGADEYIAETVGRDYFFYYMRKGISEISISHAEHEDATFSMEMTAITDEQLMFISTLTAAAFSIATTGRPDYAWASFEKPVAAGTMAHPRKK